MRCNENGSRLGRFFGISSRLEGLNSKANALLPETIVYYLLGIAIEYRPSTCSPPACANRLFNWKQCLSS